MAAGQLINRGKNVWLIRVYTGRDEGKRTYLNKTIHGTKKDAQAELTKLLRDRDTGAVLKPSTETLKAYMQRWFEVAAKGKVKARTLHDYESINRRYIEPELGRLRLSRLAAPQIQELYVKMQAPIAEGGMALGARSVRYTHAVLRSALQQAVRWGLIHSNPADRVSLPKARRREMRSMTVEQARAFLTVAEEDRFHALWVVLLTTGLRPGEALALRWSDLTQDGRLVVQRTLVQRAGVGKRFEEPKTERSRRSVPLTRGALKALAAHRKRQAAQRLAKGAAYVDQDLIFANGRGGPLEQTKLSRRFKKLAGEDLGLRMYDLRHSHATLMLSGGENLKVVSERLGHATITLTADTYSHVLPDMQKAATDRMERMLS